MSARDPAAGVTLVEMVVALAIFALIGGAGFAMLDQVLRSDRHTAARLDRLGAMQRALFILDQDIAQADGHSLRLIGGGGVLLARSGVALRYRLEGETFLREAGGSGQRLLGDVRGLRWRFLSGGGWRDTLPEVSGRPRNPQAVEAVLTLTGGQEVRQVAVLPAEAD